MLIPWRHCAFRLVSHASFLSDSMPQQEAQAAIALVNANKSLSVAAAPGPTSNPSTKSMDLAPVRPGQRHHQRMGSASSIISRTASPAKFDKFGRRILTPPMTRANSTQGSIPGTPRREAEVRRHRECFGGPQIFPHLGSVLTSDPEQLDEDIDKATSLMALYDIRMKVKEQDNTSLLKLREKIAALQARQQAEKKEGSSEGRHHRYTYPKASA